jgi:lipopolysaccharide assembly outer membrane protein LptD (OstA)
MFFFLIIIVNILFAQSAYSNISETEPDAIEYLEHKDIFTFSSSVYENNSKALFGKNFKAIYDGDFLKSDKVFRDNNSIYASGNVSVFSSLRNELIDCDKLYWDTDKKKVLMSNLIIYDKGKDFLLASNFAEKNDKVYSMYNVAYTTCKCSNREPFWQIKAKKVLFDQYNDEVKYYDAGLWFFGKFQVIRTPYFSHYIPSSRAKTGLLPPRLNDSSIAIPFYYRPKSNFDITLTPKIKFNDIFIQETEIRHLLNNGFYNIKFAVSDLNRILLNNKEGERVTNKKINKYLFKSRGDFVSYVGGGNRYGFNINLASDQKFIKKYYKIYKNTLESDGYVFNTNSSNYIKSRVIHFHALPSVPKLYSSTIFVTNSATKYYTDNGYTFSYNNQNTFYHDEDQSIYEKSSVIRLSNNFILGKSFLDGDLDMRANLISDLYKLQNNSCLGRIKPEVQMDIKRAFLVSNNIVSEPIIKLSVSPNKKNDLNKYSLIDARYDYKNFISLMNNSDYYTGSDIYNSGLRFNYGVRNYVTQNNQRFSLFVGGSKFFFKDINQIDIATLLFDAYLFNSLNLQYEINKSMDKNDKKFYLSKVGINYTKNNKFSTSIFLIDSKLDKRRFMHELKNDTYKNLDYLLTKQMSIDSSYDINQNWVIGNELRFDLLRSRLDFIYRSLRVEFHNECFQAFVKISNDNFSDKTVNLKKSITYSIGLKLKTL